MSDFDKYMLDLDVSDLRGSGFIWGIHHKTNEKAFR